MPELKLGTTSVEQLRLGAIEIKKAYLGSELVYSSTYEYGYPTNTQDRNLYTDLINDGWDGSSDVQVTINAGVDIGATSTGLYALDCQSIPDTVTLTIINKGYIRGAGGRGGNGADEDGSPSAQSGGAGGDALGLGCPTIIDNGAGYIWGGGGGGGGGGANARYHPGNGDKTDPGGWFLGGGGGGGGGAGWNAGGGGSDYIPGGHHGSAGTVSAGGAGKNPGGDHRYGGNGGGPGAAGSSGQHGSSGGSVSSSERLGGSGGAAGKAVDQNGFSVVFTAGNNSTRVKGAMS